MPARLRVLLVLLLVVGCGAPASSAHDAGHDAPVLRDAWFGDTNAADTGACTTTPSSDDVSAVLLPSCALSACHSRFSPESPGGLVLDRGTPRTQMVGVSSSLGAEVYLVIPGDPGHSLVWRKVTDALASDGSEGAPMPLGDPAHWVPLPADQLETIRCWIAGGAP